MNIPGKKGFSKVGIFVRSCYAKGKGYAFSLEEVRQLAFDVGYTRDNRTTFDVRFYTLAKSRGFGSHGTIMTKVEESFYLHQDFFTVGLSDAMTVPVSVTKQKQKEEMKINSSKYLSVMRENGGSLSYAELKSIDEELYKSICVVGHRTIVKFLHNKGEIVKVKRGTYKISVSD